MQETEYLSQEKVYTTHWWHVGRRRLLEDVLKDIGKTADGVGATVYDIGCGVGECYSIYTRYFKDIYGVDFSEKALAFAQEKGFENVICSGLENIPERHRSSVADVVVLMDILEHLADDASGAKRVYEMLKPGGYAIVTVPAFKILWGLQDEVGLHYRRYRIKALSDILIKSGFEVKRKTYFNTFLFIPILIVRILMRAIKFRAFRNESEMNSPYLNGLLSFIFNFEIRLLKIVKGYPFGVSALVIARKPRL